MKKLWRLLKLAYFEWSADRATRLAAALSYYTVFSLAPLLVIAIAVAGSIMGREAVQGKVMDQISGLLGAEGGKAVEVMLAGAYKSDMGMTASLTAGAVLLLGATGLFVQLQDALDSIWGVEPEEKVGMFKYIKDRWLSFSLILIIGFLFLVSLIFSAVLSFLTEYWAHLLPIPGVLVELVNFAFSIILISGLFAAIYKFLPNVYVHWRDVWAGAVLSSVFFSLGKYLMGIYLGRAAVSSGYGAAGSLVVIMIWSYYSAQILLYGAEFVQVYAKDHGRPITPKKSYKFT